MLKWFTKHPYSISRATPINSDCVRLPTASALSVTKLMNHAPISVDQQVQVSQGHTSYSNKEKNSTEVHGGGGLEPVKLARDTAPICPKPCAPLKSVRKSCSFTALRWLSQEDNRSWSEIILLLRNPRFSPLVLAHESSALPWLVDGQAILHPRRRLCLLIR